MEITDYTSAALLTLGVALAVYPVVRFGVKPLFRAGIDYDGTITVRELRWYRAITRASAPLLGMLLGLAPDVYPDPIPTVWGGMLGTIGGSLSVAAHHAVEAALPAAVSRWLTGVSLSEVSRIEHPGDEDTLTTQDAIPTLHEEDE